MANVATVGTKPVQAAPPAETGLTGRAKAERRLAFMLCAPAVIVMLFVAGFPILYAFWLSLHRADLRFPKLDRWVGLDNYRSVLTSHTWWNDVANTLIISVISVSLELILGMLIAQAMYRAIYARTWIRVAVLVPYGAVTVVAAFAWKLAFDPATGFVPSLFNLSTPPLTHTLGIVFGDDHGGGLEDHSVHRAAAARRAGAGARGPLQGRQGRWRHGPAAILPDHAAADPAGADGRGALPRARRVPDL
jgi:hypothetical protein